MIVLIVNILIFMPCTSDRAEKYIRAFAFLTGSAMVALGIVKFITTPNIPILAGIWTVYWMYH